MPRALLIGSFILLVPVALGDMVITEWMYNGSGTGSLGEFVEFTNIGPDPMDMTGWSFDDDSRIPGTTSLSAFGVVAPGESVILTDETAADFAAIWGLTGVKIIGDNTVNLGRNDEINLYDAAGNLVDRLAYGDQTYPGTVRTNSRSCNIPATDYDFTVAQTTWVLASDGDSFGSWVSSRGEIGSPGLTVAYALSDFDRDGDVDWADFELLSGCMTGPSGSYDPPAAECQLLPDAQGFIAADCDQDDDVDLFDFAVVQRCCSGDGNPADLSCGRESESPGVTEIMLSGTEIDVSGGGVTVAGTTATIMYPGTYRITGVLADGQIVVNSAGGGLVELILNGVEISNSTTAPVCILSAEHTMIVLADQTDNYLSDADTYVYEDPEADEPNAALFSKDTLTIVGPGTLTVHGNYNDGIASKDDLIITGATINVVSVDDGIRGKDYLLIQDANVTVTAADDALKSDNADGPGLGYISIQGGSVNINSGGDGIAAETVVTIASGEFTIVSGGGSAAGPPADGSAKGIKGLASVVIDGGTFDLDCADDAIHSDDSITINGGTITIATGDDAIHADIAIAITGGTIVITECYEGIESTDITITNGIISVTSSEDAITAEANVTISEGTFTIVSGGGHTASLPPDYSAKGIKGLATVVIEDGSFTLDCADDGLHSNDSITIYAGDFEIATGDDAVHADNALYVSGGKITVTASYEGLESSDITITGGDIRITSSDDGINAAGGVDGSGGWPPPPGNHHLYIHGGYILVNASGDGIDVNGSIVMTGGTVIVHGPTYDWDAAIDYDGTFNISGGLLVAAGSSFMAQAPSSSSTQRSVKITYNQWKTAGMLAHIQKTDGTGVLTFAPAKMYRSLVFSSPVLQAGTTYQLYRGGSSTGTVVDGLYYGGTYTPGTLTNTFTVSGIVTSIYAP
jgi:hypothetical protein